jgi:hypothetical protein
MGITQGSTRCRLRFDYGLRRIEKQVLRLNHSPDANSIRQRGLRPNAARSQGAFQHCVECRPEDPRGFSSSEARPEGSRWKRSTRCLMQNRLKKNESVRQPKHPLSNNIQLNLLSTTRDRQRFLIQPLFQESQLFRFSC